MNILFIHQNYPGQYREYVPHLAASGRHKVAFLTQRRDLPQAADHFVGIYNTAHQPNPEAWAYSRWFETAVGNGAGAATACKLLDDSGFVPDLVTGHANWGELLFVKDVWPDAAVIGLFEYYFLSQGGLVGFDPEFASPGDNPRLLFVNNASIYLTHEKCDAGIVPTEWQLNTHPPLLRPKLHVLHDGIRTDKLIPDHTGGLTVECGGVSFSRGDEIVTYVARNLEPPRGFHIMMRALPRLQALRPNARVAIVGGDGVSYGSEAPDGQTFRALMIKELGASVNWSRVHFLGKIPYATLIDLIKLSKCHIYLTVPFVVSWSMLEAMALEKTIVASNVAPVREMIEDGKSGILVNHFKPQELAERVAEVLSHRDNHREIGKCARRKIVVDYDFLTVRLPAWKNFCNGYLPAGRRFED